MEKETIKNLIMEEMLVIQLTAENLFNELSKSTPLKREDNMATKEFLRSELERVVGFKEALVNLQDSLWKYLSPQEAYYYLQEVDCLIDELSAELSEKL